MYFAILLCIMSELYSCGQHIVSLWCKGVVAMPATKELISKMTKVLKCTAQNYDIFFISYHFTFMISFSLSNIVLCLCQSNFSLLLVLYLNNFSPWGQSQYKRKFGHIMPADCCGMLCHIDIHGLYAHARRY